ncbi:MAG: LuxR C-terminal-related transcriptional regulator [Rikenellaceae bacterium]
MNKSVPVIVILTPNTLISLGLKSLLEAILPIGTYKICNEFSEIENSEPQDFFHLFVSASYVIKNAPFFRERHNKTIVLMHDEANAAMLQEFHRININASQAEIEKSIKGLHKTAHGCSHNSHPSKQLGKEILSPREIEVTKLLVEGLINKEIAVKLSISTTTVITHRKNIFEKLGIKSVAGLAIYAVMKGYIDL